MRIKIIALFLLISFAQSTTMAQRRKTNVDLIIRGGTVVTMDGSRRVIENGGVAIKGGRIVAVDDTADIDRQYVARDIINAVGKVVIPGLINGTPTSR
jgi:5-methylthioadenosine/S-adenosylhomocysteine deaminase